MNKISVIIADDHKIFREGVVAILEKEKDFIVLGEAGNPGELKSLVQINQPDVILMDINMGAGTEGIAATSEIKKDYSQIEILALSMHGEKNYIMKMLEAGARGYILKNAGREEMIAAIKTVAKGDTYLSSQVSSRLLEHLTSPQSNKKIEEGPLTDREIEVLRLIVEEYSNPEIAEKLFISIRTVDTHRRNLLEKLGVKNTAGLVKYAIKNGLID